MARVIDLGNGYGQLEGYPSKYASLTFPLTACRILRLYTKGYLDKNETTQTLLDMGFEDAWIKWRIAVADVTIAEWKARLPNARTI